jgi:hypothetical protein
MGVYYHIDIIMSFIIFTKEGVCYEKNEKNRDDCGSISGCNSGVFLR